MRTEPKDGGTGGYIEQIATAIAVTSLGLENRPRDLYGRLASFLL